MKSPPRTQEISLGLIKQLIEQKFLELKLIGYNDVVELHLPWEHDLVPVTYTTYKELPAKVIRHGNGGTT